MSFDRRSPGAGEGGGADAGPAMTPGKRTLTSGLEVQRKAAGPAAVDVHAAADHGVSGASTALPYLDDIQRSFGRHDVGGVQAHVDSAAAEGAHAMGAKAFASGDHVALPGTPDLHTAAHEAAHVVQQRGGVQLKGGVGEAGDAYEQHADAVADAVVAGRSAESLLDLHAGAGAGSRRGSGAVQRIEDSDLKARGARILAKSRTAPTSGMNLWVATCAEPAATIYLLGTNHGLRLTEMVEWKALVAFLQSTPFTHVYSETTAEIDKVTDSSKNAPPNAVAVLESKLKIERDFKERFPNPPPKEAKLKDRRDYLLAEEKLKRAKGDSKGLDQAHLDDAYVSMGLTSGRESRPIRSTLETNETRELAAHQNMKDLGLTPPPDPKAFEQGEEDPKYKEQRARYLKDNLKVTKGEDEPKPSGDDVRTGNQKQLFEEQAQELLAGRDIADAEERNKQWVDRLKTPTNLKEGDKQLWIVGAAHLPGLILRFEDLGWTVAHQGPLQAEDTEETEGNGTTMPTVGTPNNGTTPPPTVTTTPTSMNTGVESVD